MNFIAQLLMISESTLNFVLIRQFPNKPCPTNVLETVAASRGHSVHQRFDLFLRETAHFQAVGAYLAGQLSLTELSG